MVMSMNGASSCGTMATPWRCAACGVRVGQRLALDEHLPWSGLSWPEAIFIIVDLPAPFSPASAVTVPGSRVRETPLSTGTPPNDLARSRHSKATSSTTALQTRCGTRCVRRPPWADVLR